ncbi:MAG: hypothetical protein JNM09_00035 [Blastocatellia bacterium]|nr:hypothetical protein [Blastocatellia bacterium]
MKTIPIKPTNDQITAEEKLEAMRGKERVFPQTIEEVAAMEKELEKEAPLALSKLEDTESLWRKIVTASSTSSSDQNNSNDDAQKATEIEPNLPLLAMLKQRSNQKAKVIAERMGVTPTFLSNSGEHSNVLPFRARNELAKRAASTLTGIKHRDVIECLEERVIQQIAAYNDKPFVAEEITYQVLVLRSGLNEQEQKLWLSLAEEE